MLFDGVCNLCNAAVQWVLARDRAGKIHFASLQSQAGRDAIETAGVDPDSLPDSFVLIDEHGVRTRAEAALGVATHLGLPYSLLGAARVVPAAIRDAIYSLVARNRYRWFGRESTCMLPTAEVAGRFLDADEPRPVIAEIASVPAPPGWLATWLPRLAITYLLVYIAPFPLTLLSWLLQIPGVAAIPGLTAVVGFITGLHSMIMNPIASQVGVTVFGVDASPQFTGSGDTTFNHLDLLVDAVLAVVISAIWAFQKRGIAVSATTWDVSRTVARYYLGTFLLTYGWVKAFPLQFPLPSPDRMIQPYGDSSPMGLAWTFLGASVGYQIFAGLAELLGGYLLLWRRTTLLGALVSFAVMSNVFAINLFFDVPVKLFSGHLALVAVFLIVSDLPRLGAALLTDLPAMPRPRTPFWMARGWRRGRVMAVHMLCIAALTTAHVNGGIAASRSRGVLTEPNPLHGIYRVERFEQEGLTDRENEDADRWVRFGLSAFAATVQRASGDAVRMRVVLDEEAATLSVYDRGAQPPGRPMFEFITPESGLLQLVGEFEGKATTIVLRKDDAGALLTERGFRWVNEYPFNR
ncbi:MAG: DUF393 domain-containing protein [Acidobacteria bacterium]|nr:DUF393 domain-containing protein [Acidobacteriota bacterium]